MAALINLEDRIECLPQIDWIFFSKISVWDMFKRNRTFLSKITVVGSDTINKDSLGDLVKTATREKHASLQFWRYCTTSAIFFCRVQDIKLFGFQCDLLNSYMLKHNIWHKWRELNNCYVMSGYKFKSKFKIFQGVYIDIQMSKSIWPAL